ncbi:hypothetical protein GCM10023196_035750 [Actinoallomurus vinaceus]|uniref:Uncharacterized protein n=1 Tax=Actinoallomurus vinaceus TaxID=1080074 RepID=A0ABP8UBM7_9ACTN
MAAAPYDITIEQGATWRTTLTVKDATGAAVDLTGYSARMQIRPSVESTTVLLELATGSGITITGPAGQIALVITATATTGINWTGAVYDLELTAPGGDVTRLLQGRVALSPEVTR